MTLGSVAERGGPGAWQRVVEPNRGNEMPRYRISQYFSVFLSISHPPKDQPPARRISLERPVARPGWNPVVVSASTRVTGGDTAMIITWKEWRRLAMDMFISRRLVVETGLNGFARSLGRAMA